MMKTTLTLLIALITGTAYSQTVYSNFRDAKAILETGYQATPSGWIIKAGDTLTLGRGTLIGGNYTHIYESLSSITTTGQKKYLQMRSAGQRLPIKKLDYSGTRQSGFFIVAVVGVGYLTNYWVEIDNAIATGEIIVPAKYRTATASTATGTLSIADELAKLKKLKDDGILSEEEFQAQKKKLLGRD